MKQIKNINIISIIIICLVMFSINVIYTEFRFLTYHPYDPRTERSYDISVWLRLDYSEGNIIDTEIPLTKPPIPIYNDQFEVIKWEYQYASELNISNSPAYRDASLLIYAPRDVLQIFSHVQCLWEAEDDSGLLTKEDFQAVGAFFLDQDPRIENTLWQSLFQDTLQIAITLIV